MIISCIIDGFKSFRKSTYINLTKDKKELYTAILGKNGVGKSAILEGLNYLFNSKDENIDWNLNKGRGKNQNSYIVGIFACKKESYEEYVDDFENSQQIINLTRAIDEYLRNITTIKTTSDNIKNLSKDLKNAQEDYSDYYLCISGKNNEGNYEVSPLNTYLERFGNSELEEYYRTVINYHEYIYIPAEEVPAKLLTLTGINFQKVLPQKLYDEMNNIFLTKDKNTSFMEKVNQHLSNYLFSINENLQLDSESYKFDTPNRRKKLQLSDFVDQIINSFFLTRKLFKFNDKNNKIPIEELSSGEQKRAIINVFCSLLEKKGISLRNDSIILAIDEPEISQDYENIFPQFLRLETLAKDFGFQVMLTTHWYGLLPVSYGGTLILVKDNCKVSFHEFFDLYTSHDPELKQMKFKSFYDLANSVISFLRAFPKKRVILCEGPTDRIYLETYLDLARVRIIPVNGKKNVKLMAELLALNIESMELKGVSPHVVCILDTDEVVTKDERIFSDSKSHDIKLCRWQIVTQKGDTQLKLVDLSKKDEIQYTRTRIEDVVDPQVFWLALKEVVTSDEIEFIDIERDELYPLSRIFNEEPSSSMLNISGKQGRKTIKKINDFVNKNKGIVAHEFAVQFKAMEKKNSESLLLKAINEAFNESNSLGVKKKDKPSEKFYISVDEDYRYCLNEKSNKTYILKEKSNIKIVNKSLNQKLTGLRELHQKRLKKEGNHLIVTKDITLNDCNQYEAVMFAEGHRIRSSSTSKLVKQSDSSEIDE